MTDLKTKAQNLINSSVALKEHTDEKAFWTDKISAMTGEQLNKFVAILEEEAGSRAKAGEELLDERITNNKAWIEALRKYKNVTLPKLLKDAEKSSRESESPEDLLNQI